MALNVTDEDRRAALRSLLETFCLKRMTSTSEGETTSAVDAPSMMTSDGGAWSTEQTDALLYIVVVLAFYSFGVVCLMVKYLKQEKKDIAEELVLEQFLRHRPLTTTERRARPSGRLALDALNAVNVVLQPPSPCARITFV